MKLPIYLDNMASTPVDPRVTEKMLMVLNDPHLFGNPAALMHSYGWQAKELIESARQQVAQLLNASPEEITWTSGATEANNLALLGAARFHARKGKHIITSASEHKSVLAACEQLEKEGFQLTILQPKNNGLIDVEQIAASLRDDTILLSLMWVNNEIGVIQNIHDIAELTRNKGILFHCDAVQAVGKLPIDLQKIQVDLLSMSAHKLYGPKGVGALYVRQKPRVRLHPLFFGGEQERGLRAGTLATHQIVGMGEAFDLTLHDMQQTNDTIKLLRDRFWAGISQLPAIILNGDPDLRVPHNLNFQIQGIVAEALLMAAPYLALSTGSACNSVTQESSYVLRAIGLSNAEALSSIRISFGKFNTIEEIDQAIVILTQQINRLRTLSPCWN